MELPLIGLGTWDLRGHACTKVVRQALEMGYPHIDTAHSYENHTAIRPALKEFNREKFYLTSKLEIEEEVDAKKPTQSVQKACDNALKELGTDYLDLYLIHWPYRDFPLDQIFEEMENLVAQGKIRKAGVSNYNIHHLEDLGKAGHTPYANQVEFHPYLNQNELLLYCNAKNIRLIAYRPLGKGRLLQDEPIFAKIGQKYGKTGAQVILRWVIEQNIPVLVKSESEKHLRENLEIFDFSLSQEDRDQIDSLDQKKRYCQPDHAEFSY
ncbi:MAG: aldo/keto reductase [Verrucomicrobia bacterium]|nr:aldo/keto reductase [Verrucomicrobiota bacterium]